MQRDFPRLLLPVQPSWWPRAARLAIMALSVLVFAACHTHVRVAVPRAPPTQLIDANHHRVQPGDEVRATLVNGDIITFVVDGGSDDALFASDGRRVLYRDMARLDVQRMSKVKTTAVVVGLVVVVLTIGILFGNDSDSGYSPGGTGVKVICTELCDKGLLDARLYATDLQLSRLHISPTTLRGYHLWAIPYVRLMRRSRLATRLIQPPAVAWAQQVCFDYASDRTGYRSTALGKLLRLVGEPACWAMGIILPVKQGNSPRRRVDLRPDRIVVEQSVDVSSGALRQNVTAERS